MMPVTESRRTPGVYITERTGFPPSIVGVQTAVPAFIGYTERADINGKPVLFQPIKIGSLVDYQEYFGAGFKPVYNIMPATKEEVAASQYDFKVFDSKSDTKGWKYYNLVQDTETHYNLYNSMRLFYGNGGGNCYVVSVGTYRQNKPVSAGDLLKGLDVIAEQVGPTMLVIPDAILLPPTDPNGTPWVSADFKAVVQEMLKQSAKLQDRVAILDVYGTQFVTMENLDKKDGVIDLFHQDVANDSQTLSYGVAYFPFLNTSVITASEFTYMNFHPITSAEGVPSNSEALARILSWENTNLYPDDKSSRHVAAGQDIDAMKNTETDPKVINQLNQNLTAAFPLLGEMERIILAKNSILPPSGAMAGAYTYVDSTRGVWNAPANLSLSSVNSTTFNLNDAQQGDLNVPIDGKAINALREFTGRGTMVWGARTLDGNSNDYHYIQVRRTLIYIEQSVKAALNQFVFAANDGNTWTTVISMVSNFLQGLWAQGGLMGATAAEAFTVQCGLGSTMTPQNILEGYMIVQLTLQMIRPAEFIELTFKQEMEGTA
jgi:phage tail sheath protein FI